MNAPLCFLDTETTGVHPDRLPWEIAMIRRDEHGDHQTVFYIGDVDLSAADPFGLQVGGFYERHPQYVRTALRNIDAEVITQPDAPEWVSEGTAARLVEYWTRDAHIVGAVPNFDTETLAPMLRRHGLIPSWHYHLIDVEALAVGFLAGVCRTGGAAADGHWSWLTGPPKPPWKSDDLSRACGVEPPSEAERHTALGDARWAMRLYDAITGVDMRQAVTT